MCQKCVKRNRNMGNSRVVARGKIEFWAHKFLRPFPFGSYAPLWSDYRANMQFEARVHQLYKAHTARRGKGVAYKRTTRIGE